MFLRVQQISLITKMVMVRTLIILLRKRFVSHLSGHSWHDQLFVKLGKDKSIKKRRFLLNKQQADIILKYNSHSESINFIYIKFAVYLSNIPTISQIKKGCNLIKKGN